MAWITPIVNWIQSNVLTHTDMNRIEGNIQYLEDNKVDKVDGKGLSTEDYTTVEKSKLAGIEEIPTGVIVMWAGVYTSIPMGWALCNGANGTPDLRDRFVMGSTDTTDHKTTGGANTVSLTESQLPSHTHTSGTISASSSGAHSHTITVDSGGGAHTHTASSDSTGSHTHTAKAYMGGSNMGHEEPGNVPGGGYETQTPTATSTAINSNGAHSHTITVNSGGAHTHTASSNSTGAHTHGTTGSTGSTGSGSAHENRPAFYKLAFIMKV